MSCCTALLPFTSKHEVLIDARLLYYEPAKSLASSYMSKITEVKSLCCSVPFLLYFPWWAAITTGELWSQLWHLAPFENCFGFKRLTGYSSEKNCAQLQPFRFLVHWSALKPSLALTWWSWSGSLSLWYWRLAYVLCHFISSCKYHEYNIPLRRDINVISTHSNTWHICWVSSLSRGLIWAGLECQTFIDPFNALLSQRRGLGRLL